MVAMYGVMMARVHGEDDYGDGACRVVMEAVLVRYSGSRRAGGSTRRPMHGEIIQAADRSLGRECMVCGAA